MNSKIASHTTILVLRIIKNLDKINKYDILEIKRLFSKQIKSKELISNTQLIQSFFRLHNNIQNPNLIINFLKKNIGSDIFELQQIKWTKNLNLKEIKKILSKLRNNWEKIKNEFIELLQKRSIRSQSWIVSIQTLTKPFPCPGQCIFCPNDPTMPKSYIKTEPGAMRAYLNNFDPIKQVYNRLLSLTLNWHKTDKIEMIVLWWTRDVYPKDYKIEFIKWLYDACNTFEQFFKKIHFQGFSKNENKIYTKFNDNPKAQKDLWITDEERKKYLIEIENINEIKYSSNLQEAIKINETAPNRIIWLTIETRPEFITDENCKFWRELWVTRLEIWLQSTDNEVLEANKRWHTVEQMRQWLHKLRQYWFKFSVHMMPWLYKSNVDKDIQSLKNLYSDPFLKPDELKLYPTSVIPNTELFNLYKQWKYKPLTIDEIKTIVRKFFFDIVPPRTRIKRLIRDIPATEIESGSNITNLNQLIRNEIKKEVTDWKLDITKLYERMYQNSKIIEWQVDKQTLRNFISIDTRSREIRNRIWTKSNNITKIIRKYKSSVGDEYFISIEDELWYLYWFVRLLLPQKQNTIERQWLWKNTALIRELHVYWKVEEIKKNARSDIFYKIINKLFNKKFHKSSKNKTQKLKSQHIWIWKQLMQLAENIAQQHNYNKISVISWVWVRWYYKKLWYQLEWTYMIKTL